jgi:hypothetical protein
MIVEILTDVATEFAGDDLARLAVETVDAEIDLVPGVQDSNFRFFRGRLAFDRFFLKKIRNSNR